MKRTLRLISIGLICFTYLANADAAVRVVAYNCANRPNNATDEDQFRTVFQAIGNQSVNGIAKRLDLLVMAEMDPGSVTRLTTVLNNLYNVNTYTNVLSSSVGGDSTGVIYDSNTLTLAGTAADLTTVGTHPILRAHFRPAGSTAANEQFYVYAIHLKSGDTASDIAQRATEATNLRNDADALGQGAHIIYTGDFNSPAYTDYVEHVFQRREEDVSYDTDRHLLFHLRWSAVRPKHQCQRLQPAVIWAHH